MVTEAWDCETVPATDSYVTWAYSSSTGGAFVADATGGAQAGTKSLHGPDINDNQLWQAQALVYVATGAQVSFYEKVISEASFDFGRFLVDGTQQLSVSGVASAFTSRTYSLAAGRHTLLWQYSKDVSVSTGLDNWFLDQIQITNVVSPPPPIKPRVTILRTGSPAAIKRMDRG